MITLSLMVLMTLVAVGLLTLSSISLRSATQGDAMATAQANARMALILAIGQLQKSAGPDQRVTARADLLDSDIANPHLTGVWDSWEIDASSPPRASDYEESAKDAKFRTWLASGADPDEVTEADFASRSPTAPVKLWGEGSLGKGASPDLEVNVDKLTLATRSNGSETDGTIAWAVLDEGVKARINTSFVDAASSTAEKTAQLGTGQRPGVEFIDGLDALGRDYFEKDSAEFATLSKGVSRPTYALAGDSLSDGVGDSLQPLLHDVTTHSMGLFTDTARGGLRKDFHLLTNSDSLPDGFSRRGIYQSQLGMGRSESPADPTWDTLSEFSRLYRNGIKDSGGVPVLPIQVPAGWRAATTTGGNSPVTTVNTRLPIGTVMMPTIAKVQMIFSLIGRDIYNYPAFAAGASPPRVPDSAPNMHGPQDEHFRGTKYDYDLHLLYTPVVTLHNPYNVALEFTNLRVEFHNVPFAMQVFRNGIAQSTGLVPLETMYGDNSNATRSKVFGLNLKTKVREKPGSVTFRLLPGEVKLFSPYIDPNRTYQQDLGSRQFWDIYVGSGITSEIDAIPGWRGDGIGFDCDWLAGAKRVNGNKDEGRWESCLGLAWDDQIHVEFAPLSAPISRNKFVITMSATPPGSRPTIVNAIEMDYENPKGLQDTIMGGKETLRFPSDGVVMGHELVDHSTRKIKEIVNVKPFAVLSAQAKVTNGGRDSSGKEGKLSTMPWAFAHANIAASTQKIVSEHSANHSHEIDLQLLERGRGTTDVIPVDINDRGNFISGHSTLLGSKFGIQYDVPIAPIQSFASLNGSNPGGISAYLPRFAQPIGNSWAHPGLPSDSINVPGNRFNFLDHSFLLNLALYDSFYFSGMADQTGPYGNGKTADSLAADFVGGAWSGDPRLGLNVPDGQTAADLAAVVGDDEGYRKIAAWQTMLGAFNVNSTSVPAWKAMLASIHDPEAIMNLVTPSSTTTAIGAMNPAGKGSVRISRMRMPASQSSEGGADPGLAYWLGPREYSGNELQLLAENIVEQVRLRGPFLSMAEFVNRRIGSDDTAQRGALQQAIDDSGLNEALAEEAAAGFQIGSGQVAGYKYANPEAGVGPSYQGAPGFLTQADVLSVLGNAATARSDTFTIRGYGEALDASGKVLAKATCEAIVQRTPEWLDAGDQVETAPADLSRDANKTFGRRFVVTSFRWLNPREI